MVQSVLDKTVFVGDIISFNIKGHSKKNHIGVVSYCLKEDNTTLDICIVSNEKFKIFKFEDIETYQVIKESPFHFDSKKVFNISENSPTPVENTKPFQYQFGESACNVFKRWSNELSQLKNSVDIILSKIN